MTEPVYPRGAIVIGLPGHSLQGGDMETVKQRRSLVEETYDILVDAICTGEIRPGERLNHDDIASRLNVSRQPVNSAISILKANGLVEDTGRRSVIVTPFDRHLFRAIYDFRVVIEPFAVRQAGKTLTPADRATADAVLRAADDARRDGSLSRLVQADMKFHEMIYGWSRNPVIETSMRMNWHHIRRSMAEILRDPAAIASVWAQHFDIVEDLFAGEIESAASKMENHIRQSYDAVIRVIETNETDRIEV
jgi:DNA-binding GntR family transcriptional regulator